MYEVLDSVYDAVKFLVRSRMGEKGSNRTFHVKSNFIVDFVRSEHTKKLWYSNIASPYRVASFWDLNMYLGVTQWPNLKIGDTLKIFVQTMYWYSGPNWDNG